MKATKGQGAGKRGHSLPTRDLRGGTAPFSEKKCKLHTVWATEKVNFGAYFCHSFAHFFAAY